MELTELERKVLEVIKEYCSELDMETTELLEIIEDETEIKSNIARGVIGSLAKKNIIKMMEINGEPSVWYPED